jgi:hypothetical protein
MFTRVVELTSKPGKAKELSNTINEKGVPILKKQNGFEDEIILNSEAEPDRGSLSASGRRKRTLSVITASSIGTYTSPCGTSSKPSRTSVHSMFTPGLVRR